MAKNQTVRVNPGTLKADEAALTALRTLTVYAPSNQVYSVANIQKLFDDMNKALDAVTQAYQAADTKRDEAALAEWAFHNAILGVKSQVVAQFGADSNEVQMLGLKKKSEYKTRTRKQTPKQTA